MEEMTINLPTLIAHFTETEAPAWQEVPGPDSRCGTDWWYRNDGDGTLTYVNLDQEYLTVSVCTSADDPGERVFEGDLDEVAEFVEWRTIGQD